MEDQISSEEERYLRSIYTHPFVYKGLILTQYATPELMKKCEQFEYRPDDIVVASYPRSGTTLTQEMVWQIVNHDIVTKDAHYGPLATRFPYLELNTSYNSQSSADTPTALELLSNQSDRRFIKTHLPYSFMRDQFEKVNPKMIVAMRNPKDNVVSCFPFYKGFQIVKDEVSFSEYWQVYMAGRSVYGDFCDFNLQWWALRDRENVLILRYEDLVHQPFQEVQKIAAFLGFSLSAEKVAMIVHNTTFAAMSKNEAVNFSLMSGSHKFLRKGKCGDWRRQLTVAQSEAMDDWIAERLGGSGLRFTYE